MPIKAVINCVKLWILLSALLSASGWILSALGQLNGVGYVCVFALAAAVAFGARKQCAACVRQPGRHIAGFQLGKVKWRFRHVLPAIFFLLAVLALIGGILHAPNNYDALTYRLPRVFHWLSEGQWHWVHSQNPRLNTRVPGIEWLSAPLLLLTKSDRFVFLINWGSFLLLPGLLYSLFIRLGVRTCVAWHWMWLLPTGYNFALQAGSIGNDTFATVYALAAVDFALRARVSRRESDVWFSVIAAALLTGSKLSNLPLLLPWAIALFPAVPLFRFRTVSGMAILLLAVIVSFLPTAALNLYHGANWSGGSLEDARFVMKNPLLGIAGNSLVLVHQNFAPPVFPWASAWNELFPRLLPEAVREALLKNFESGFLKLGELPGEETAGLGLGVSGLLAIAAAGAFRWRHTSPAPSLVKTAASSKRSDLRLLYGSFVAALLVFMTQSGLFCPARIISPYYPFLATICLLAPGHLRIVRTRWWEMLEVLVGLVSIMVVILTPSRPLWPAQRVLAALHSQNPDSLLLERAQNVYSVYSSRADGLAPLRQWLPEEASVIGFISSGDDPEAPLWRPFGQRRVRHVLLGDDMAALRRQGVEYYVIGALGLKQNHGQTIDQWTRQWHGLVVGSASLAVKVSQGRQEWYVVKIEAKQL